MRTKFQKKRRKGIKASPVKIAYYIQRMIEKKLGTKEIIIILSSLFDNEDIIEFARTYKNCSYREDIKRIANLIYNIPTHRINDVIDMILKND